MSVRTQNGHGRTDISVYCTYKLKWKPLFDGKARLDIQSHYKGALPGMPLCPSVPKMGMDGQMSLCTAHISSNGTHFLMARLGYMEKVNGYYVL